MNLKIIVSKRQVVAVIGKMIAPKSNMEKLLIMAFFSGNGSPRWKQRAFYDFCRDIFAVSGGMPVYRLAIYEKMAFRVELGKALLKGDPMILEQYFNQIRILN